MSEIMSARRNALLMVATLLAATSFQLGLYAPDYMWGADSNVKGRVNAAGNMSTLQGLVGLSILALNSLVFYLSSGAVYVLFSDSENVQEVEISLQICGGIVMCNFWTLSAARISTDEGSFIWRCFVVSTTIATVLLLTYWPQLCRKIFQYNESRGRSSAETSPQAVDQLEAAAAEENLINLSEA